jgi:hypothetical protein
VLRDLAALQGLPAAPDFAGVWAALAEPLTQYAELELRSDSRRIDLITLSEDPAALLRFLDCLQARGVPQVGLAAARALAHFASDKVIGMKLPVAGPLTGGEMYVRGALPLAAVGRFLSAYVPETEILAPIEMIAACLDKRHTHMLAVDIADPPRFTVFFTVYLKPHDHDHTAVADRLRSALAAVGIEAGGADALLALHALLGAERPQTLFFSWGVGGTRVKVDYQRVPLRLAAEVMQLFGLDSRMTLHWGQTLGLRRVNYVGVIVASDGLLGARTYFTGAFVPF